MATWHLSLSPTGCDLLTAWRAPPLLVVLISALGGFALATMK